jgi:hypothetical protein
MQKAEEAWNNTRWNLHRRKLVIWSHRAAAVVMVVVHAIFVWDCFTLVWGKPEISVSYALSHLPMPPIVDIVFISTPLLAWLMFVGAWSLSKLHFKSFYRFTVGNTNANTFSYFTEFLGRLAPTIALHYLRQVRADESAFESVMSTLDVSIFMNWRMASPVLLVLSLAFFGFRWPEKIQSCCYCRLKALFVGTGLDTKAIENGLRIMKENGHELAAAPPELPDPDYGLALRDSEEPSGRSISEKPLL